MTTSDRGRQTPQLSRPETFYTTHPIKAGETLKAGTMALLQDGELVDADATAVGNGGVPVIVDRPETPLDPAVQDTPLHAPAARGEVRARVMHGGAFLLNVDKSGGIDKTDTDTTTYIKDNDTVQVTQPVSEPVVGKIVRVESSGEAFVRVQGMNA